MRGAASELLHRLAAFLEGGGLWWSLGISLGLAAGSLALAAAVVVGWSADHFKAARPGLWEHRHPVVRALGIVGKNVAGVVMVLAGLVMTLPGVPGQGILTMIIGLTLVDFPGKR